MKYKNYKKISLVLLLSLLSIATFNSKNFAIENEKCNQIRVNPPENLSKYLLGPGDLVSLNVFSSSDISGDYQILNDGNISLPIIGSVNLKGLTIDDAIKKLEVILGNELYSPSLDLFLKNSRLLSISVVGEINRPGVYKLKNSITLNEDNNSRNDIFMPRLLDAIIEAGGVTSQANVKNICLIRKSGKYTNELIYYKFNLSNLIRNGGQEDNPYLFDEDIIKVNKIEDDFALDKDILKSSIAPEYINIKIIGEVNNPGSKKIKNNSNILDAISSAGGTTFLSSRGNAEILRLKNNGQIQKLRYKFNLNNINQATLTEIFDGDTIFISRNQITKATSFLMKISEPLYNIFRILEINKELKN